MIWQIYVFIGLLALGTSALVVRDRVPIDVKVGAAAASFVLWTLWGFASYNVEVVTNTGTVVENHYVPLVLVGLVAAAAMLGLAIWNIMSMFGMDPQRLLKVRV